MRRLLVDVLVADWHLRHHLLLDEHWISLQLLKHLFWIGGLWNANAWHSCASGFELFSVLTGRRASPFFGQSHR